MKDLSLKKYSQLSFYSSDIRWFDYQQGIYEINNKKEMKSYEINESLYSRSYCGSLDIKQSVSSSKNSQNIKEMLNETNIMQDEFYHIIGENQENSNNYGILQPNSSKNSQNSKEYSKDFKNSEGNLGNLTGNSTILHRNSSINSVFKNNTLVQPNLLENLQKNDENSNVSEANCDIKAELLAFQMKKCLFHYKGITEKIERHLADEKNIFGEMKRKFISIFSKKHHYFYRNDDLKTHSKQIFKELKSFINFLVEILSIFYKFNEYKTVLNYFLFTKENLLNFITSLLFDSSEISDLIFEINQKLNKNDEISLEKQYENAKDFMPADFEVSNKYCLNEKTLQYILEKKTLYSANYSEKSQKTAESLQYSKKFSRNLEIEDDTQKIKIKLKEKPFQKAIKKLQKITRFSSPLHKLKTILQASDHLFKEIRDFYEEFDVHLNEGLGGDELLGLFVYIVAQAKIPDLLSHCAIIKTFLTSNLTNSISGYYVVTIQVALDYLLSMKITDKKSRTFSSMKEFHQYRKGFEKCV